MSRDIEYHLYTTHANIKQKNKKTGRTVTKKRKYITVTKGYRQLRQNLKSFQFVSDDYTAELKPKALLELSNPDVVYELGGNPCYIHSANAYFDAGLAVANREMSKLLKQMVGRQKAYIQSAISYINNQWKNTLEGIDFQNGGKTPFEQFQIFYNKIASRSISEQNEYFDRLSLVQNIRTLFDLSNTDTLNELKRSVKNSLENNNSSVTNAITDAMEAIFQKHILPIAINIKFNKRGQGISITNQKEVVDTLNKQAEELFRNAYYKALDSYKQDVKAICTEFATILGSKQKKAIEDGKINPWDEDINTTIGVLTTRLGHLFEVLMKGTYQIMFKNPEFIKINNKIVEIGEAWILDEVVSGEKINGDNVTQKADTRLTIDLLESQTQFSILVSDKTGQSLLFDGENLMAQERASGGLSAILNKEGVQPFGEKVFSPGVFSEAEGAKVTSLMNYVLYNAHFLTVRKNANTRQKKLQGISVEKTIDFKKKLLCYLAWLSSAVSFIGAPQQLIDIPLAIRTSRSIYNTADLLDNFLHMEPNSILDVVGTGDYWNFVSSDIANEQQSKKKTDKKSEQQMKEYFIEQQFFSQSRWDTFVANKDKILSEYLHSNRGELTYSQIYSLIAIELGKLMNGTSLPSINTYWNINLGNLKALL